MDLSILFQGLIEAVVAYFQTYIQELLTNFIGNILPL